jgi:hypothetical protein
METDLTGRTADPVLAAAVGDSLTTAIYEGLCAGNSQSIVRGVAVCYAPTVAILRRAAAEHKNLILSREHPYFLHGGLYYRRPEPVFTALARKLGWSSYDSADTRLRRYQIPEMSLEEIARHVQK